MPVVGLVTSSFTLDVNAREVADAFEVPLAFLMDAGNHQKYSREARGQTQWHALRGSLYLGRDRCHDS